MYIYCRSTLKIVRKFVIIKIKYFCSSVKKKKKKKEWENNDTMKDFKVRDKLISHGVKAFLCQSTQLTFF